MATIDLGELREGPSLDVRPTRSRPPVTRRPLWTALASLLVLTLLAADQTGPTRIAAVVPGGPGARVFFAGDLLLVEAPVVGTMDGAVEVVAYPLPERATRVVQRPQPGWRARLPAEHHLLRVQVSRGRLLLTSSREVDFLPETTMLDTRTGRVGWRQPGTGDLDVSGRLVLRDFNASVPDVRAVDVATGRTLWSVPIREDGLRYHFRDGAVDRLVLIGDDGFVEVRDTANAALLHRANLGLDVRDGDQRVEVVGDLLLNLAGRTAVVTAYDLEGLRRRWSVPLPLSTFIESCGPLLCAVGTSSGLRAIDPATGVIRWNTPKPAVLIAARADRLLLLPDRTAVTRYAVLDALTGEQLTELNANDLHPRGEQEEHFLGIRRRTGNRQVVVGLDLAAVDVRTMDVIMGAGSDCGSGPGLTLVCRSMDGTSFGVWRWSL
ncbi:hypothetical protein D7147_12220 [Micromonospora musae]|uniref:Pyrrolo-quinoline quinone repeat domain-containing protein n=1 Tax=Micromonospora musae TaxID=1894970 RepID=A0ABX9R914_9ACTN|nr:PQQ-binding-like beta-propeller repeat protein [Micromonospora musae]RKN19711.1 hypothetical protein D7147_12220 [Micromonospora musae]